MPADETLPVPPTPDRLYLVDGSGYIFRAFHALPPLTRPDGTPVNAVFGFTTMLMKLLAEVKADAVAVVFDAARRNFRNDIYPAYKAQRPDPPPELIPQFPLIRTAAEAFCLPVVELDGYEADDLIATYARQARESGRPVTIVSSDKDLMQLVAEGVGLLDPIKNKPIGRAEVLEKFGVPPEQVVDVQALAGDSVDNVPGVPGIGIKTAAQLIGQFGDLETLLGRLDEIKQPKRRQTLADNAENARVSRRLVLLDDHAPVPVPLGDLTVRVPDYDKLLGFLREQGFRTLVAKVEGELKQRLDGGRPAGTPVTVSAAAESPPVRPAPVPVASPTYVPLTTPEELAPWLARIREAGLVSVDTETVGLVPSVAKLVGISLAVEAGQGAYIPVGHIPPEGSLGLEGGVPDQMAPDAAVGLLKEVLEDPAILKIGHNLKFDLQVFGQYGVRVAPIDDTMLISYVLEGGRHGHGMDELAELHLQVKTITYDEVTGTGKARVDFDRVPVARATTYAAEDADITLRLHQVLKPKLVDARLVTLYETIERPLVPVVADMEARGVRIDAGVLRSLSQEFAVRLQELEAEIHGLAGRRFNVASPKQLGEVLFDEMRLAGGKKGKTGAYSTDSAVLEPLAEQGVAIAAKVLDWRQLAKLRGTYTETLQEQIAARTGRVHTSFGLALTNTGRLSSSEPNLQNIPIRTEEGRKIRTAFVAEPGWKLLSVDYSQIELRLVAEIAGITALQQAFRDGIDIHALTASQVFGVPLERMTSELRRQAKAINFGIIYGISGFGLSQQLGITPGEAKRFIDEYLGRFHELRDWMQATREFARAHGYVLTRFGRRCHIPGIGDKNAARRSFAERQAINAPIQGTAADIIKRAMIRMPAALAEAGSGARMLLQVHDELLFEVPAAEAAEAGALIKGVMEGAAHLAVPLVAEVGIGDTWAAAH